MIIKVGPFKTRLRHIAKRDSARRANIAKIRQFIRSYRIQVGNGVMANHSLPQTKAAFRLWDRRNGMIREAVSCARRDLDDAISMRIAWKQDGGIGAHVGLDLFIVALSRRYKRWLAKGFATDPIYYADEAQDMRLMP